MFQPTFLEKEAKINPFKSMGQQRIIKDMDELKPMRGEVDGMDMLGRADLRKEQALRTRNEGNGLVGDMAIGSLKYITPKSWGLHEKALNAAGAMKDSVRSVDTKITGKALDKMKLSDENPLARLMSTKEVRTVAKAKPENTTGPRELVEEYRRASLLAPVQNTAKVTAPLLGTMYVADKMYPMEEEKQAFYSEEHVEKNGLQEELRIERLDKQAAFQKLAMLEEEVEKLAEELSEVKYEKDLFWRESEKERMEKKAAIEEKTRIEQEYFEKRAAYEEFKLRTTKRERVKHAVKIAEELLEDGIIKQAEFDSKVDFLVDCDDTTFNLHSSMVKRAQTEEKGLETSPFFVDYRSKDEESAQMRQKRGLSKRGQTIGEAARDLHK